MRLDMKRKRIIITILLIFFIVVGITIAAAMITGIYDPDNTVVGNNLTSSGYGKSSFHSREFQTIEEAMQAVTEELGSDYDNMTLLYEATTGNLEKVFMLESTLTDSYKFHKVNGYEFIINKNGTYSYSGNISMNFEYTGQTKKYDWKTTALSDLSNSTKKWYKKLVNPRDTYGVLSAWGVSDTDKIKHMTVDGQSVDHVIEFSQEGQTYYLWIIDDLQTENNAVDIVVDVKEEQ